MPTRSLTLTPAVLRWRNELRDPESGGRRFGKFAGFSSAGPAIPVVATHDDADAFDAFFYCTYHADLKGFSARQARRHFRRHGWREARPSNPSAMLRVLQAQEGPLPADFSSAGYAGLNGDLRGELRHSWQAAEHYLKHGRHHGRRYRATPPIRLTDRSSTDLLRRQLILAFGEAAVSEALMLKVHKAVHAAERSSSLAAPLMEPVLLARWLMTSSEAVALDAGRFEDQLNILFKTAFQSISVAPRSAVEMEVINRLRSLAIVTEVFQAEGARPPVTLLMLATEAACKRPIREAPTSEQARAITARFFARDVPRLGLERFVTPHQRSQLRAPVGPDDARPLAALMLEEAGVLKGAASSSAGPPPSFLEKDVWLSDMDYVLSSEQLEAAQLQVVVEGDHIQLSGPSFLFDGHQGAADHVDWGAREAALAWLQRFVRRERRDRGLPQSMVAASASAYVSGTAQPRVNPALDAAAGEGGRKLLRVGDLLTFGAEGAGSRHLIGRGWHSLEAAHVWSAAPTALLAINLEEEDVGPLDLFLRLSPGPRRDAQVSVWWNGHPATTLWPVGNRMLAVHCHLGAHHRSGLAPNILCLGINGTFQESGDGRRLGIALYDLMLVRR